MDATRTANGLAATCHEASTALLPGLVNVTLGAAPVVLGAIEAVAEGAGGAGRVGGGAAGADPRRRPRLALAGLAGPAAFPPLAAASAAAWQVGVARVLAQAARGLRPPQRYAAVAERVAPQRLGRAMARERRAEHLGAALGPALAFACLALADLRVALALAVLPGLAALWVGTRGPRAGPGPPPAAAATEGPLHRGPLGRLLLGIGLFELANIAVSLLILRAIAVLGSDADAVHAAVGLYVAYRVVAAALAVPAGALVDRLGAGPVLAASALALLAAYAGLSLREPGDALLLACFAVAGAAAIGVECAEHAGVGRLARPEQRSAAYGMLGGVQSAGRLVAALTAGTLWSVVSPQAGLLFAAPLLVGSALAVGRLADRRG